jgi:hypothetical protein
VDSVRLRIDCKARFKANGDNKWVDSAITDRLAYLGGLGPLGLFSRNRSAGQVQIWQDEPEWAISSKEHEDNSFRLAKNSRERRVCTRTSHFVTTIQLNCPPTFDADIVQASVSRKCFLVQVDYLTRVSVLASHSHPVPRHGK